MVGQGEASKLKIGNFWEALDIYALLVTKALKVDFGLVNKKMEKKSG